MQNDIAKQPGSPVEVDGDSSEEFFTLKEIAEKLKVHVVTPRRAVHKGELKALVIGRHIRVRKSDLDEYINRNSTNAV